MLKTRMNALGFDTARLMMGFRTAVGCCLALFLALALGLDHPQWAGMSVWAAAQPLRGQVLEKSAFRFGGTVIGTGIGVLLVIASQFHPVLMVCGIALWIGLCTWGASLWKGLPAYGVALAGYSASLVALIDFGRPENVVNLGLDRLATVLLGVLVGTVIAQLFAPSRAADGLGGSVRRLVARILRARAAGPLPEAEAQVLLARLAAMDESLDPHGAGSPAAREAMKFARRLLLAGTALVLEGADPSPAPAADLLRMAKLLETGQDDALRELVARSGGLPDLALALEAAGPEGSAPAVPLPRHTDPPGAREAGLRAFGVVLLFGLIWALSGWAPGAYMFLGLTVMIAIFSSFETPVLIMRHVILGQVIGVTAMLACQMLLWPLVTTTAGQLAMMIPFLLMGPFLSAHRRTVIAALDFHMVFLLLSQPHVPFEPDFAEALIRGLAVVAAPLLAWAIFALIWPADPGRRLGHLKTMMLADLAALALHPRASDYVLRSRSRLLLRALPAASYAQKTAPGSPSLLLRARAHLALQSRIPELQLLQNAPGRDGRAAAAALRRLSRAADHPLATARALHRIAATAPVAERPLLQRMAADFDRAVLD